MSRRILVMGLLAGLALLPAAGAEAGERGWRQGGHHGDHWRHQPPRHIVVPPRHHRSWQHSRGWQHDGWSHHKHWRPHGGKVWYYRPGHGFQPPPVRHYGYRHHHRARAPFVIILKPWW